MLAKKEVTFFHRKTNNTKDFYSFEKVVLISNNKGSNKGSFIYVWLFEYVNACGKQKMYYLDIPVHKKNQKHKETHININNHPT